MNNKNTDSFNKIQKELNSINLRLNGVNFKIALKVEKKSLHWYEYILYTI